MIKPASDLIAELVALGVRSVRSPRDSRLFCPSVDWLQKFGVWIYTGNPPYKPEAMDCDDFAIRAIHFATESLNKAGSINGCGHAFGYAQVTLSNFTPAGDRPKPYLGITQAGSHATNLVRTQEGWRWFEPQNGSHCPVDQPLREFSIARVDWVWL